jgi:hypothetical protein
MLSPLLYASSICPKTQRLFIKRQFPPAPWFWPEWPAGSAPAIGRQCWYLAQWGPFETLQISLYSSSHVNKKINHHPFLIAAKHVKEVWLDLKCFDLLKC